MVHIRSSCRHHRHLSIPPFVISRFASRSVIYRWQSSETRRWQLSFASPSCLASGPFWRGPKKTKGLGTTSRFQVLWSIQPLLGGQITPTSDLWNFSEVTTNRGWTGRWGVWIYGLIGPYWGVARPTLVLLILWELEEMNIRPLACILIQEARGNLRILSLTDWMGDMCQLWAVSLLFILYSLFFHSVHPVINTTSDTSSSVYILYIT
jgi:hypothetical protein